MKFIALGVLCIALFVSLLMANRFTPKQIPTSAITFLWVLLATHTVFAWWLQRFDVESASYRLGYYVSFLLTMGSALMMAQSLGANNVLWKLVKSGTVRPGAALVFAEALMFGWIGTAILLSLYGDKAPASWAIKLAFGLYLTSRSVMAFIFAAGFKANYEKFLSLNSWLPALPSIAIFVALAIFLALAQRELSHQELPAPQVLATEVGE